MNLFVTSFLLVVSSDGSLKIERILPNGVRFRTEVQVAGPDSVQIRLRLVNGSDQPLTGLKVQNCLMLKAAVGFEAQSNWNKRLDSPLAMAHSDDGTRWIVMGWEQCERAWANPPVPCLHADPQFSDLAPGQEQELTGWIWFYQGEPSAATLAEWKQHLL